MKPADTTRVAAGLAAPRLSRREVVLVVAGQALAVAGGLVGVRLLTRAMSPASYGELALAMTVAMFAQQLLTGPLAAGFMRFFAPARQSESFGAYLAGVRRLVVGATCALMVLMVVACAAAWALDRSQWAGLLAATFVCAMLVGANGTLDGMQNAARHRAVVAWHQGVSPWLRFLFAVGLIALLGSTSTVAMAGYALCGVLLLASRFLFFKRLVPAGSASRETSRADAARWSARMRGYSWPFATWGLFTWAHLASDRWALEWFGSTQSVGLYAVVLQLGYYPLVLATQSLGQLVAPLLFDRAGDGTDARRLQHACRFNGCLVLGVAALTLLGALLAQLLHPWVFRLFADGRYHAVSWLLPWMVIAGGLYSCGQLATLSLLSGLQSRTLVSPKIATALAGVVLNVLGAWWLGLPGLVAALVAYAVLYFGWIFTLTRRQIARIA